MEATEQEERLLQLGQLQNEAGELQRRLAELVSQLESWSNKASDEAGVVEPAKRHIQKQMIALEQLNPTLISLNFKIHDFVTRCNIDVQPLKSQVHALYRDWDQIRENINNKLNWLEVLGIAWNDYQAELYGLKAVLEEDRAVLQQLTQTVSCSPDLVHVARSSKTFLADMSRVSALNERLLKSSSSVSSSGSRSALVGLTKAAHRLRQVLSETGRLSLQVAEQLREASTDIEAQESECQRLLSKMTAVWEEEQDLFKSRSCEAVSSSKEARASKKSVKPKSRGGSLIWRVIRAALPIQLAVVILFCFAYLFEPHCCDSLNNFNLSFTPQLRYFDGPPPV